MKITFDTLNEKEVAEVVSLLELFGMVRGSTPQKGVTSTETVVEDKKTKKTTPTITEEKKDAVEPEKTPVKKTESKIGLADLKESAKKAVGRSSREEVKTTIGEFAEKLAEVDEADYGKLYKKLQALGV